MNIILYNLPHFLSFYNMHKDFDIWNEQKKNIELIDTNLIICKRRQFWLCKIGENIGSEVSKTSPHIRPVLIINERLRGDLVVAIPMTTKYKDHADKYYHKIDSSSLYGLNQDSYCMLDQIKVISKKRLVRKLNDYDTGSGDFIPLLDKSIFMEIVRKIHTFI